MMKDTIELYLTLWGRRIRDCMTSQKYKDDTQPAPPVFKRKLVAHYAQHFQCNVLIETGTYLGEMIEYQAKNFEKIYSIEVADLLYNFSSRRLKKKKNISVMKGDSSIVLGKIMELISQNDRVLFWLDGHYSGGKTGMGGAVWYAPSTTSWRLFLKCERDARILF